MVNPNRQTSEDVLRRLKEASYERMRVELKCSIELLMKDFDMDWDDIGQVIGLRERTPGNGPSRAEIVKHKVVQSNMTLGDLNLLAHIFSCEPYIIFRPRSPWTKT